MSAINTNELNTSIEQFGEDMNLVHQWAQGNAAASVVLGGVSTPSIRNLVASLLNAGGAAVCYQTKAQLDADLAHGENTLAFVTNDSTASKLGWYIKVGASGTGSWKQSTYDRTVTQAQLEKYLHGVSLITSENADAVCGSDADNLPAPTIYTVSLNAGVDHMPMQGQESGLIMTLSTLGGVRSSGTLPGAACQIFVSQNTGDVYVRGYRGQYGTANGDWSDWVKLYQKSDLKDYVAGSGKLIQNSSAEEICGSDADNLPTNTIYTYNPNANIENLPKQDFGAIVTLSRSAGSRAEGTPIPGGSIQLFITIYGEMFIRNFAAEDASWYKVATEVDSYMKGGNALISSSNAQEICGYKLGNLPTNTIWTVNKSSGITDFPVEESGLALTMSRSPRRDGSTGYTGASVQQYISQHPQTSLMFYRTTWGDGWAKWRTAVPMDSMNILGVGDSICAAWRDGQRGLVGNLGMPYANYGISSWRLSSGSDYGPIASQLDTFASDAADSTKSVYGFVPDVIIANGGINDYYNSVPLGTVPTAPVNPGDTTTVIGGLQLLFYKMITMYPKAQRLFVLVHKMGNEAGTKYFPTDANNAGYTQEDMTNAIIATCRIYGVKPVDVYHEGQMDTSFDVYLGNYEQDSSSPAWCNIDRCHPLRNGYLNVYVPLIMQALVGGTKKA